MDSDDSQLRPLSFETSSVGVPLSSFRRNIKEQFGTFFQVGETSQVSHPEAYIYIFNHLGKNRQCDDLRTSISKF